MTVSKIQDGSGLCKYRYLPSVMLGILSIPVAQAEAERQFSMLRKNCTSDRSEIGMNTLDAIMTLKTGQPVPCYKRNWSNEELRYLKNAATRLNESSASESAASQSATTSRVTSDSAATNAATSDSDSD